MKTAADTARALPEGSFTTLDGREYYRIAGYDRLPPFLMSIPSDGDLWMFVSSRGGLTAGRGGPDGSLFPYETADKLHDAHHHSGPVTWIRAAAGGGEPSLWSPFADLEDGPAGAERNLYKSLTENALVFEETHPGLGLAFRYRWSASNEFGWVRAAVLQNLGSQPLRVSVLDGLRNVLPYGAPLALYQQASCLVDAYKRADLDPGTGLAVYSLTSKILDRPLAAEELRANCVFGLGLPGRRVALAPEAVSAFRRGEPLPAGTILAGRRGNYLAEASFELAAGGEQRWWIVADVARDHARLAALRERLLREDDFPRALEESRAAADGGLRRIVASADGLEAAGEPVVAVHHFANVLFNCMRGGVLASNYDAPLRDLRGFLAGRNAPAARRHGRFLDSLPPEIHVPELIAAAEETGDADLIRLCLEYLPLYFGRRHGDPSRPWNLFAIRVRNADGTRALHYEGNWRDIFQNWEALSLSFPGFLPGILAKFVNASTVDGFNPYRLSRDGVDWEVIDRRAPWSHIGYWGDHQIVYLTRLLEAAERYYPGATARWLDREIFSYADVPYRLEPYGRIVENHRETIRFDFDRDAAIAGRVRAMGTDGKLLLDADGSVHHVSFLEKLLVPVLCKLANYVPDGGIWMNTQRPEWNDANNALVGNGLSVVTLCHLRRHLARLEEILQPRGGDAAPVSREVASWMSRVRRVLEKHRPEPGSAGFPPARRREILDGLGEAFSEYRETVYARGFSGKTGLALGEVLSFCALAREHLDHAIRVNRREDGLYHAYNLLDLPPDGREAKLERLHEMLEGQVAALSSGAVSLEEAVRLVDRLFESKLYREDQRSFMLYPERELPGFPEKNRIPERAFRSVPLLGSLAEAGDRSIVLRDAAGVFRFAPDLSTDADLVAALDRLAREDRWTEAVARDRDAVLDLYEEVFRHRSYTGRSGTMYAYEGLGCVYWHMVAKLLLAVQEQVWRADAENAPAALRSSLSEAYYRIRAGLGFEKSVAEYGAFPTDPYSHTPPNGGAQQPGMTGQVKEEILTRLGELGVRVEEGTVRIRPLLLRRREFREEPGSFRYFDTTGGERSLDLPAGSLAFTFCQVPFVYLLREGAPEVRVHLRDGTVASRSELNLDAAASRALFDRSGEVSRIEAAFPAAILYGP